MNFKTHNQIEIDINGSCLQGEVTATYAELCDLFGSHHDGDGYKVDAEWYVQFDDGTIATIYNWKNGKNYEGENGLPLEQIDSWHIGGNSKQAETNVQIALDLHREGKASAKEDKVLEAFGSVFAIFESLAATKGKEYSKVVELALHCRKRQELFNQLIGHMVEAEVLPPEAGEALSKIDAMLAAKIIGIAAADLGKLGVGSKKDADELMSWTDRIIQAEQTSAKKVFGDLFSKEGKDD